MTPGQWLALGIVGMSLGCAWLAAWVVVLERRCAALADELAAKERPVVKFLRHGDAAAILRQIEGES